MNIRTVQPTTIPLDFSVRVPGSKSVANRALVCAALADGPSTVTGVPEGDDVSALLEALGRLGAEVRIERTGSTATVRMESGIDASRTEEVALHARLAGTTSRFLLALAALQSAPTIVDGDPPLRARPIGDLIDALGALGARVEALDRPRSLPVRISRAGLTGGRIVVPGSVSSQFVSALAMIGPTLEGGLHVAIADHLVSSGYVRLTLEVMRAFGVEASMGADGVECPNGTYRGCEFHVPPDASSATYPAAAVAIVGGRVLLADLVSAGSQPDRAFPDLLERMGCRVTVDGGDVVVERDRSVPLTGITIDMGMMSDAVPALAVVAACATTPTVITGIGFIRGKESDRIGDLAAELRRLGANVETREDGLSISPSSLHGSTLATHHDHRLAMAFAVLGLGVGGLSIENPGVVTKSWPSFWSELDGWTS
jgi:3-phosphoshikimate 1-carboxyvinyltransferase